MLVYRTSQFAIITVYAVITSNFNNYSGGTEAQCLARFPHSQKVQGSIPGLGFVGFLP